MLELAHKERGKLAWSDLVAPASAVARDGFAIPPRLAAWLVRIPSLREEPAIRALYYNADGSPKKLGERIANPELAETMRLIAEQGPRVFYQGEMAAEMVERVRGHRRPDRDGRHPGGRREQRRPLVGA